MVFEICFKRITNNNLRIFAKVLTFLCCSLQHIKMSKIITLKDKTELLLLFALLNLALERD